MKILRLKKLSRSRKRRDVFYSFALVCFQDKKDYNFIFDEAAVAFFGSIVM